MDNLNSVLEPPTPWYAVFYLSEAKNKEAWSSTLWTILVLQAWDYLSQVNPCFSTWGGRECPQEAQRELALLLGERTELTVLLSLLSCGCRAQLMGFLA